MYVVLVTGTDPHFWVVRFLTLEEALAFITDQKNLDWRLQRRQSYEILTHYQNG